MKRTKTKASFSKKRFLMKLFSKKFLGMEIFVSFYMRRGSNPYFEFGGQTENLQKDLF